MLDLLKRLYTGDGKDGKVINRAAGVFIFLLCLAWSGLALAQEEGIGVAVEEGTAQDRSTSKITLTWKTNTGASYSISLSSDGQNWVTLADGITSGEWADPVERKDYMNYYYRVKSQGGVNQFEKAVAVYPPNTNAHANYVANPAVCKECHQTHKSIGSNLLKEATVQAICETCHWGNIGSKYNVKTGEVTTADGSVKPSLAGPLGESLADGQSREIESWGGAVTSTHDINDTELTAPGGKKVKISCASCHSGHVTGNYRNLLDKVGDKENISVTGRAVTTDNRSAETGLYSLGYNDFCSACHGEYDKRNSGSGVQLLNNEQHYRHTVNVGLNSGRYEKKPLTTTLPLESGQLFCGTCHYAHGTTVVGLNKSEVNGNGKANNDGQSTMLKRRPEMGVCQDCHKK